MPAQLGNTIVLTYGPQGAQQLGDVVVLSYQPVSTTRRVSASTAARWLPSDGLSLEETIPHDAVQVLDRQTATQWGGAQDLQNADAIPWGVATATDLDRALPWAPRGIPLQPELSSYWGVADKRDLDRSNPWGRYDKTLQPQAGYFWVGSRAVDDQAALPWGGPLLVVQVESHARFTGSTLADSNKTLPWNKYSTLLNPGWGIPTPPNPFPDDPDTVFVPIKRIYMVLNSAYLTRVDGSILLPTFSMSLSLDVDSWTWGFSATLPGSALSDLEPSSLGAPVEVEAMINGVAYRALVESIGRSREFGKSDIRVQGRGRTALLDNPYAPVQSFTNTEARTAQQLMADVLTESGVPLDWTVDWGLTDWLVPTGVFVHQGTRMSALTAIAGSVGAHIIPHASNQSFRVANRYPTTPWSWSTQTPDFELPAEVTTREGIEWAEKARYNRVFVSGVQQGVVGQVTRTGTAGDLVAPLVTDPLITTADAARQRGMSVLGNTGRIANVSLRLPVLEETGIIAPGKFVRYVDGATTRTGIVRSVGVEIGLPEIWQTIGVETHVN